MTVIECRRLCAGDGLVDAAGRAGVVLFANWTHVTVRFGEDVERWRHEELRQARRMTAPEAS